MGLNEFHGYFFWGVSVACVGFFAVRGKIDPLLMGLLATLIYFFPGFIGQVNFPYGASAGEYYSKLMPGTYVVMIIVLVSIMLTTFFYDRFSLYQGSALRVNLPLLPHILIGFAIVSLIISIGTVGKGYLCTEKSDVLARLDGWYSIASYAAPLAFATGLAVRAWGVAILSGFILVADLFLGFRAGVSVALISFCLLSGNWLQKGLRKKIAYFVIVLAAGAGLFLVKQLAWNLKYTVSVSCQISTDGAPHATQSAFDNISNTHSAMPIELRSGQLERLVAQIDDVNTYIAAFKYAEPMVTQSILNEVVGSGFQTPKEYIFDQVLSAIPGGKTLFGIDVSQTPTFNKLFQKDIFPLATFGMANNPWAQAYSAGGYGLVVIFASVYSLVLAVLAFLFIKIDGSIRGGVVVVSGWWGFYVHRNDVFIEFGIIKMVLYIFFAALLIAVMFYMCNKGRGGATNQVRRQHR